MTSEPIASLTTYPGNARRGDIEAIAESLRAFGQYRPIVVQESTGHVLAGNHTMLAAKSLGWTHIDVHRIDVDDAKARRIVLADNRHADRGHYDLHDLADLLQAADTLDGTGYADEDLTRLLEQLAAADDVEPTDDEPSTPADTAVTLKFTEHQAAVWSRFTLWLKDIYTEKDTLPDRLCEYLEATEGDR
ncbi:ParB N-terminal domain-containing protein [Nocardia asteroides]|uniref:ParB N-terminal domain-containing protein n=1 Tax=Nocardia asteroides TaxID=1824 RepID=UPI0033D65448